jgi:hypothetical protein
MTAAYDDIFPAVPIGSPNALTPYEIWQAVGKWAEVNVKRRLDELAQIGRIKGQVRRVAPGGFAWVYWRDT